MMMMMTSHGFFLSAANNRCFRNAPSRNDWRIPNRLIHITEINAANLSFKSPSISFIVF